MTLKIKSISLGSIFWVLNLQYFIIQFIVAQKWHHPYSLTNNTISDLGNNVCGRYRNGIVCSPEHNLMNISFVVLGLLIMLGSFFIYKQIHDSKLGFFLMGITGIGAILVGLFPENTVANLHLLGAALPFVLGNIALLIFGFSLNLPKYFKYYTIVTAIVAMIAIILFVSHVYIGLGIGGVERFGSYPQTIWQILFGFYLLFTKRYKPLN